MNKYEYFLKFWGQIQNDDYKHILVGEDIKGTDFWFDTKNKRDSFIL